MTSWDGRQTAAAERVEYRAVSLTERAVSWLILKVLSLSLLTVVLGIGFATFKYFTLGNARPAPPVPFGPAVVTVSAPPPLDYREHPPRAGLTDHVPVQFPVYAPPPVLRLPPLPAGAHGVQHRPVTHALHDPLEPPLPR